MSGAVSDSKPNKLEAKEPEVFTKPPSDLPIDKPYGAGLAVGLAQGIAPGGTMLDGSALGAALGYKRNHRYELGMATGQFIGAPGLMLAGGASHPFLGPFMPLHPPPIAPPAPLAPLSSAPTTFEDSAANARFLQHRFRLAPLSAPSRAPTALSSAAHADAVHANTSLNAQLSAVPKGTIASAGPLSSLASASNKSPSAYVHR